MTQPVAYFHRPHFHFFPVHCDNQYLSPLFSFVGADDHCIAWLRKWGGLMYALAGYVPWLSLAILMVTICWLTGGKIKKCRGLLWHNGTSKVCDVMPSTWKGHALGKQCTTIRQDSTTAKRGLVLMSPEDKPFIFPIVSWGTYFLLFILAFINQWVMSLASESKRLPSCGSFQNEPHQRFGW